MGHLTAERKVPLSLGKCAWSNGSCRVNRNKEGVGGLVGPQRPREGNALGRERGGHWSLSSTYMYLVFQAVVSRDTQLEVFSRCLD